MAFIVSNRWPGQTAQQELGANIGENRLQISNEDLQRRMQFGTRWQYLKIGIRFAVVGGNTGSAGFATLAGGGIWLGVCEAGCGWLNNNLVGDYWGAGIGGGVWTCQGSPAYYTTGTNVYFYRKFGGSQMVSVGPGVAGTSASFSTPSFSGDPRYTRSVMYVVIIKGSPNYTAYVQMGSSQAHGQTDWTRSSFQSGMGIGAGAVSNLSLSGGMAVAKAGSRELMDNVSLLWGRTIPSVEIWDFAVTRFY